MSRRLFGDFVVGRWSHPPWVAVWDPQGFQDEGCQTFLTFWAWQDVSPRRLRRWARQLAPIWTWLRVMGFDWQTATMETWAEWACCHLQTPADLPVLARQVETLYRLYAFWHWYDPHRVPRQPWPRDQRERERWLYDITNR